MSLYYIIQIWFVKGGQGSSLRFLVIPLIHIHSLIGNLHACEDMLGISPLEIAYADARMYRVRQRIHHRQTWRRSHPR